MGKGLLYCQDRQVDCMQMYIDHGTCSLEKCVLDDPEYLEKEKEKEQRRNELSEKERRRRQEEQDAARKIRKQTRRMTDNLLQEEIDRKREQMERYYRKGWTRYGDNASRELAALVRRMEGA